MRGLPGGTWSRSGFSYQTRLDLARYVPEVRHTKLVFQWDEANGRPLKIRKQRAVRQNPHLSNRPNHDSSDVGSGRSDCLDRTAKNRRALCRPYSETDSFASRCLGAMARNERPFRTPPVFQDPRLFNLNDWRRPDFSRLSADSSRRQFYSFRSKQRQPNYT